MFLYSAGAFSKLFFLNYFFFLVSSYLHYMTRPVCLLLWFLFLLLYTDLKLAHFCCKKIKDSSWSTHIMWYLFRKCIFWFLEKDTSSSSSISGRSQKSSAINCTVWGWGLNGNSFIAPVVVNDGSSNPIPDPNIIKKPNNPTKWVKNWPDPSLVMVQNQTRRDPLKFPVH